ncbi:MAG: DinB family protein [Candidatus Heimdallarchaeota archaeon]
MSDKISDKRNVKEISIDLLAIAECNLLASLIGLNQEDVSVQIANDINHILWIFGHCASHLDYVINGLCQGKRMVAEEMGEYFAYGATKETVAAQPPISFGKLIELYLKISEKAHKYLEDLPDEKYQMIPEADAGKSIKESVIQTIQRLTFHFMGHTGQIILLRRKLGKPGFSFVGGITVESRNKIMTKWKDWWKENKESLM